MKKPLSAQLIIGLGIFVVGGAIVGGEYFLVKWYPGHRAKVQQDTLKLTPFQNEGLGIEMQVAAGINQKSEVFSGGVRIYSPGFLGTAPSLTLTSQPNPDHRGAFTPQELAIWETDGVQHNLWRYQYEQTRINDRDAVLIWQYKNHAMLLTARIISPERIVEANCTPGSADENLYMQACDESVGTIKVAGPPSPPPPAGGMELVPNAATTGH